MYHEIKVKFEGLQKKRIFRIKKIKVPKKHHKIDHKIDHKTPVITLLNCIKHNALLSSIKYSL